MRRRSVFRFWLLSVFGLVIGTIAPSVCAALCSQGLCTEAAPVSSKSSCCHEKSRPDKCPKCDAQVEISAKKGQLVPATLAQNDWQPPVAVLPTWVTFVDPLDAPMAPVVPTVRLRAPPPDPSVGPIAPRAPPMPVV